MANNDVVVVCEAGRGQTESANARLIATGAELSRRWSGRLVGFLAGHGIASKAEELSGYVDELHLADSPALAQYTGYDQLEALLKVIGALQPGAVLLGHTFIGMDLGPRLAARLGAGVASNCMGLADEGDAVCFVRPMYRGRIHAKVVVDSRPVIATLQLGSAQIALRNEPGKVIRMDGIPPSGGGIRPIKTIEPDREGIDITKADIVVSGGRGIGTKENYALVNDLAEALGGVAACSRPLVDMGWFGTNRQVGLSGNTVKPKLYVACGISGAIEHLHGMKESGLIVAINQDPGAPIFKVAHLGLVGDLNEIVPKLTAQVKAAKAGAASRGD
jgi:electron transfer flavoprotein alpha subunit